MSQDFLIILKSSESDYKYHTRKNKKQNPDKLKLKKFDPTPGVRKHVVFNEAKK